MSGIHELVSLLSVVSASRPLRCLPICLLGCPFVHLPVFCSIQVRAVSARLLELHALLGGGADIDVIWMVTREPTLLTASKHQLISRLMAMKVSLGHEAL